MGVPAKLIELDEEGDDVREGDLVENTDYFFDKIGKPIPILHPQNLPLYALDDPTLYPARPLAVSESRGLLFLAHPSGFLVARTKYVMDAAIRIEDNKSSSTSIQDMSVVDVPIGKVHILTISTDSSTLAVTVDSDIHFYNVDSLLNQELKPSFSCSLSDSTRVKDLQWRRKSDNSYIVLSHCGELYHGALGGNLLNLVMDNVDAVEWSVNGKFIAVARDSVLIILSSEFKERLCISLPLKSWIAETGDNNCLVKVDSIKWVRHDSIIVGCFQQTTDGKEESYLLQVIRSKDGKITETSSKPAVLSFYDLFLDIVPYGSGPYLCLSYLEQCGLAITAHKKNMDQHIKLLGWSDEDEISEAAVIDIARDTWVPRIELQDNGDDNLIMGLCVDKVSLYGKVKVEVGLEEQKELSPYCVLMCVTLEGKLVMFQVASAAGANIVHEVESASQDEDDTASVEPDESDDESNVSSGLEEQTLAEVASGLQLHDMSKTESNIYKGDEITMKKDLMPPDKNESSMTSPIIEQISHKYSTTENVELKSVAGQQSAKVGLSYLKTSLVEGPSYGGRDSGKTETQKLSGFGSGLAFTGKVLTDSPGQTIHMDTHKSVDPANESSREIGSTVLPSAISQSWSGEKFMFSEVSGSKSPSLPSNLILGNIPGNTDGFFGAANAHGGKPSHSKDSAGESASINFSVAPVQKGSVVSGTIDSLPTLRSSQLLSQENFALGRSPNHKPYSLKDDYKTSSLKSEPYLPKQFGNIKELAKELDTLLECIEESGGFRDASTVSLRGSVEALEEGMGTLSENCRMLKSIMDERLEEIQHLLDKTVQVLARKIYVDGIVKQVSDSRYLELWNRQKLSCELELKRRCIMKLNQELTNQLVQLERHFNTLELQSFGRSDGLHTDRRALQSRFLPSRHLQSLHSLQNTMSSQLAAAEQLSESLSKQMSVLSIESPVKQKNIKKELFETIGIPYDASFSSPDLAKVSNTSSLKKLVLSSGSAATKVKSRRHQLSASKSSDSETSRRRRDSLDQSWASFEPTKTTVKRVLLQESQMKNLNKSSMSKDRQPFSPSLLDRSAVRQEDQTSPPTFLHPSENKGFQYASPKQALEKKPTAPFKWAIDPPSQPLALRSPTLQRNNATLLSPFSSQVLNTGEIHTRETYNMTANKSNSMISHNEKSDSVFIKETKRIQPMETGLNKKSAVPTVPPTQTSLFLKRPNEMPVPSNGNAVANLAFESVQHGTRSTKSSFIESSGKSPPFSSLGPPVAPALTGKAPQFNVAASKSQPIEKGSSSLGFSSIPVLPSSMINSSVNIMPSIISASTSSLGMALSTSLTSEVPPDDNRTVPSTLSSASSSPVFSSDTLSFQAPKTLQPSYTPAPISEPSKELQPPLGKIQPSAHLAPPGLSSESPRKETQPFSGKTAPYLSPSPSPLATESLKTEPQAPFGKSSPSITGTTTPTLDFPKTELPHLQGEVSSKTDVDVAAAAPSSKPESATFSLKLEPSMSSVLPTGISTDFATGNQPSLSSLASPASNVANSQPLQQSAPNVLFGIPNPNIDSATSRKNESLDVEVTEEDEMEEEAPETSGTNELNLGGLGGFGLGSTPSPTAPRANPFGGPFGNTGSNIASSSLTIAVPSGELFRPASFNFQSPQPSQPSPPTNLGAFSGSFATGAGAQSPAQSQFGQPAQIGPGQQALGSVLGSFGQSRQFGTGLPGSGFASTGGFGGGFATSSPTGGFASTATGGGFAALASAGAAAGGSGFGGAASGGGFGGVASGVGGFGGVASGVGGFAGVASGGSGFAGVASGAAGGGGFAAVPASGGGFATAGGFGAFGSQQGSGGFSAFGSNAGGNQQGTGGFSAFSGNAGGTGKPPELFTQMRR